MTLSGQQILVTGGAIRIGRAFVERLVAEGATVIMHYNGSADAALALAATAPDRIFPVQADLGDAEAVERLIPDIVAAHGPLTGLINNAAIFLDGGLEETTLALWEKQHAINLRAPFFLCQAFARQLPEDQPGHILQITDARAGTVGTDHLAYRLTKDAVLQMVKHLAVELAPRIRVNAVGPGAVLPPPGAGPEALEQLVAERVPLRRPGSAEWVVDAGMALMRNEFSTGVVWPVDGGEFL